MILCLVTATVTRELDRKTESRTVLLWPAPFLSDDAARLKAAADKLDKDAPTLTETERSRRQRELVEQDRELQRKRRAFQEDLNLRKNEELANVVERANKVIKQIFDQEKYDLIVQEGVVFAGPRVDITDKVIRALNSSAGNGK